MRGVDDGDLLRYFPLGRKPLYKAKYLLQPLTGPNEPSCYCLRFLQSIIFCFCRLPRNSVCSSVMALVQLLFSPWTALAVLLISYLYQHLITYRALQNIPGPLAARLSNLWLFWTARRGKRHLLVDQAHKKYGTMMRIQPNHISVNDDSAISLIYGHGNGFLKSFVQRSHL